MNIKQSINSKHKRNVKLWGIPCDNEIKKLFKNEARIANEVSRFIFAKLRSGEFLGVQKGTFGFDTPKGKITAAKFKDMCSFAFNDCPSKLESARRSLVKNVMGRYLSYKGRNKKYPNSQIRMKQQKAVFFNDDAVTIDKSNRLLILNHASGQIKCKYSKKSKNIHLIQRKKFGGVLKLSNDGNSCYFVVAIDKHFNLNYDPKCFLGYDINLNSSNWIVFNDGEVIKRDDSINKIIKEIKELNSLLNDKKNNVKDRKQTTRQRRKTRVLCKRAHRKLKKSVIPIIDYIIKKAVQNKAVICLDSVKTGNKNGTFAQDYLTKGILTRCQNEGIPYYVVPTPFTTVTCNECGFCSEDNKINSEEFSCLHCGNKCLTHFNASKNITAAGELFFAEGLPFGDYSKRKVKKHNSKKKTKNKIEEDIDKFLNA